MQCQIAFYCPSCRSGIRAFIVDFILHVQHVYIGSQRHLPYTIPMEVELIFYKIFEVLTHCRILFQRLQEHFTSMHFICD